jgi:hypothetical protein
MIRKAVAGRPRVSDEMYAHIVIAGLTLANEWACRHAYAYAWRRVSVFFCRHGHVDPLPRTQYLQWPCAYLGRLAVGVCACPLKALEDAPESAGPHVLLAAKFVALEGNSMAAQCIDVLELRRRYHDEHCEAQTCPMLLVDYGCVFAEHFLAGDLFVFRTLHGFCC